MDCGSAIHLRRINIGLLSQQPADLSLVAIHHGIGNITAGSSPETDSCQSQQQHCRTTYDDSSGL
jgi:hypothetical protein